jgi:hypothetical protein
MKNILMIIFIEFSHKNLMSLTLNSLLIVVFFNLKLVRLEINFSSQIHI